MGSDSIKNDAPAKVDAHTTIGGLAANMSPERRAQVEKKLKRKLDARCSLFVLIYIMNYLDRYVVEIEGQNNQVKGEEEMENEATEATTTTN